MNNDLEYLVDETIRSIDRDFLKAILAGGTLIRVLSRSNEITKVTAWVAVVEIPKNVIIKDLNDIDKYWKYLVFHNTPDIDGWWHSSSNNFSKRENLKKIWDEWSELKYYIK